MNPSSFTPAHNAALSLIASTFGTTSPGRSVPQSAPLTPADVSRLFMPFADLPYSADLESLRGFCLENVRKNQLALYVYNEVLVRSPCHAPTLRRKGQLLKKMNQQEESNECLSLASLLEPDNLHLEILRDSPESDHNEEDEDQGQSSSNEEKQEDQSSIWKIRIKSIDRPVIKIKSAKSVLFKKQLLDQEKKGQSLNLISMARPTKSILRTKSQQLILGPEDQKQIESTFDVRKIQSIDGKMSSKMSSCEGENKKEVIFAFGEDKAKEVAIGSASGLKRKSSLMASKIIVSNNSLR